MSSDQRNEFEVMVVLAKRIDEGLGNFEPADVEEKLQERKHRHI